MDKRRRNGDNRSVPLRVDESADPVIVVEIHGRLAANDIAELLDVGAQCIARQRPYAIIYVPLNLVVPSFQDLKLCFHWMREHSDDLARWYRAMALVTASPVLRGTLRAILSLGALRMPHLVTSDLGEALAWARNELVRSAARL